VHYLLLI